MFYEYQSGNHTRIVDLDNVSWIDLQTNDVGMDSHTCVVYTSHGTHLTLLNEDALEFVKQYKAYKTQEIFVEHVVSGGPEIRLLQESIDSKLSDATARLRGV